MTDTVWRIARGRRSRRDGVSSLGAILLEVVLSLSIFVAAAAIIYAGMSSSMRATQQLRFQAKAADLAVSKLSEMQMHPDLMIDSGPNTFEDADGEIDESLDGWTWTIATEPVDESFDLPSLTRLTVTVANEQQHITCRLVQLLPAAGDAADSIARVQP